MMGVGDLQSMIIEATTWVIPVILAVTLHEAAHGFVAYRLGDSTAYLAGRMTLNPLRHVDPFGTIVLPLILFISSGFLFGYAKPVPVDFRRLNHPRRDMVLVALAGPGTNILIAVISALLYYGVDFAPSAAQDWLAKNLINSLQINAILCVFNMLPLPPLDGGRVAVGVLPNPLARPLARLEPFGMIILISLFLVSYIGVRIGLGFSLLNWLIGVPTRFLLEFILRITGHA